MRPILGQTLVLEKITFHNSFEKAAYCYMYCLLFIVLKTIISILENTCSILGLYKVSGFTSLKLNPKQHEINRKYRFYTYEIRHTV